jgi:hypothetical protein
MLHLEAFNNGLQLRLENLFLHAACVATQIEQELKARARSNRKRTARFGKPDGLVLSGPTTVWGTIGRR